MLSAFMKPVTMFRRPRSMARTAMSAQRSADIMAISPELLRTCPAASRNSVRVPPGHTEIARTPVPFSS